MQSGNPHENYRVSCGRTCIRSRCAVYDYGTVLSGLVGGMRNMRLGKAVEVFLYLFVGIPRPSAFAPPRCSAVACYAVRCCAIVCCIGYPSACLLCRAMLRCCVLYRLFYRLSLCGSAYRRPLQLPSMWMDSDQGSPLENRVRECSEVDKFCLLVFCFFSFF